MRKRLALVAAVFFLAARGARAAAVDIIVDGWQGEIFITNNSYAGDVFGVSLVFGPKVTGYSFGPTVNSTFSSVDFSRTVLPNGFVLLSAGPLGTLVGLGQTVSLGTLRLSEALYDCSTMPGYEYPCVELRSDPDNLGPLVLSRAGTEIDSSISVQGGEHPYIPPYRPKPAVPEPAAILLVALGFAAFAASRRRA